MSNYEIATIVLATLNLFAIAVSAIFIVLQIEKTVRWNRLHASQNLVHELGFGEFQELYVRLKEDFGINIHNPNQAFQKISNELSEEETTELKITIRKLLNFLEMMAIGMKNNILNEKICREYVRTVTVNLWNWSKDYIIEVRKDNPRIWVEIESFIPSWYKSIIDDQQAASNAPAQGYAPTYTGIISTKKSP